MSVNHLITYFTPCFTKKVITTMNTNKSYTGIDIFRFIAALMVISIHTSPLISYNSTADFILTRVISRTAVPFFFMTSGFFLLSRYNQNYDKLKSFLTRTSIIYLISILIYIPVNIYTGYFKAENTALILLKDIIFDGTMYHLWYLPAAITGALISWYMIRKLGYKKSIVISGLLYLIGLFGDSYYGISSIIPQIKGFYDFIFGISSYTRNGIFFAPIFFVLGGFIRDQNKKLSFKHSLTGFIFSFCLMLTEALLLYTSHIQRHDSMYVYLPICMYFLFSAVIHFKGKRFMLLRNSALIIYIIHPMVIIAVRMFSKLLNMNCLFIENSLISYIIVSVISVLIGITAALIESKFKSKNTDHSHNISCERAFIEIDLKNLEHNTKILQAALPPDCRLMAVVKAKAYGHSSFVVSSHLNKIGVKAFAVATIEEGIKLRKYGITGEILILGYTNPARIRDLKKYDLTQTLTDYEYACELNRHKCSLKAHIKIDTGMHRLGIDSSETDKVKEIFEMKNIKVCGIYTHLCCSDSRESEDITFTKKQISDFYKLIEQLKGIGFTIPKIHIQSSYGLLNYPELKCDYIRAGIALYGVLSTPANNTVLKLDLRPVLSLKTKVILIRSIKKGDSVGYGRCFTASRDSRIAILSIGYGDGYPRVLSSGQGNALIRGYRVPVIGNICMDQLTVDITDTENIVCGDTAELIGSDNDISAPVLSGKCGSISNELLCRMGRRLPLIVKSDNDT